MYEIIKEINETTKIAVCGERIYMLKKIYPQDMQLYKYIKSISNRHIAKIVDFASVGNDLYAVSLYVQGDTLKTFVEKNHGLSDRDTADIASQLCNGLKELHERGIIHRDINPNNIIIQDDMTAVIIDFGISRFQKMYQSRDTQILGTQGYAAPEQFGFNQTSDKSDIYSLGVVINYMKTGQLPSEKMCGGFFEPIVNKCIEIDENNRYADVEELYNTINNIKTKKLKNFIREIPGFKEGKWYFQLSAGFYYFIIAIGLYMNTADCIAEQKPFLYILLDDAAIITMLLAPILIIFNANHWLDKFKYTKNASKAKRVAVIITFTVIIFLVGGILADIENIIH